MKRASCHFRRTSVANRTRGLCCTFSPVQSRRAHESCRRPALVEWYRGKYRRVADIVGYLVSSRHRVVDKIRVKFCGQSSLQPAQVTAAAAMHSSNPTPLHSKDDLIERCFSPRVPLILTLSLIFRFDPNYSSLFRFGFKGLSPGLRFDGGTHIQWSKRASDPRLKHSGSGLWSIIL